jgi:precorrin-2 dehydrogenase/sirohydrochlorin ferrochelatase
VFIAGLQEDQARPLYEAAHEAGALVNTEDMRALCDFHMPAVVRRGDLLLTASTGGKSPGLARQLRKMLEQQFGPEWESILEDVATARQSWLDEGLSFSEVAKRTETYIEQNGWLA